MKWLSIILFAFVLIQNVSASARYRHQAQPHNQNNRHYNKKLTHATAAQRASHNKIPSQRNYAKYIEREIVTEETVEPIPELEVDTLKCPLGCVCQYAHFMDLPISRWINYMQMRQPEKATTTNTNILVEGATSSNEELINDNESVYGGDETFLSNDFIKQATCILQADNDVDKLINSLPHDLQALILLYTDIGRNKSVNLSILKPLDQLSTLEIRGPQDLSLTLLFDEPLSFLKHANFESIALLSSETFKQPKNPVHPSDTFEYKPRNFANDDDDDSDDKKLDFEKPKKKIKILPYEIYMHEMKKARTPSFYGWEHLEVLRIHACQLNELYWEMFDGLGALQHLSLERNGIVEVPPFAIYGAMHIKTLSLAHNQINDLHYRGLAGLLELEMLDLSDNRLSHLSEHSFPPFPKLERCDFRNNPIQYIWPASFWVMNTTRSMFFDSREQPLELWGNMTFESLLEMRELYIGNVTIDNLESSIFKALPSLEKLTLKGDIRRVEFDAFAGLTELRQLDLSHCQIREVSMDALMGCKQLRILNLSNNNISYIPPGLLDDQLQLEEIYLQGNQLRTLPNTFFLQPRLRLARLTENPWKCSCDMSNWKVKIVNQEHTGRTERCINEFQTGMKISCRQVDSYKFDHRYAPRCANYNERSVFYVLRKQLQCGPGRIVRHQAKHRKIATKMEQDTGSGNIQKRGQKSMETVSQDVSSGNRLTWQIQREQKIRRTMAQKNTLDYVLQQERKKQKARSQQQRAREEVLEDENIFSNDI